ncbi:molybdopterin synthase sulfur carrier subunit [Pedobacter sp. UYEF25]
MKVSVKYFGLMAELAGKNEEVLEIQDSCFAEAVKLKLVEKYNIPDSASVQLAVNKTLDYLLAIEDGDELALLPPFAGG